MFLLILSLSINFQFLRDESLNPVVRVLYSIDYSELTFIKMDTLYQARYRLSLTIYQGKDQVGGVSKTQRLSSKMYGFTISSGVSDTGQLEYHFQKRGKFKAVFEIWDMNSLRHWKKEESFNVENVKSLALGEIVWEKSLKKIFSPKDTIKLSLNVFNPQHDSVVLLLKINGTGGASFIEKEEYIGKKPFFTYSLSIPGSKFSEGEYSGEILIKGYPSGKKSKRSIDFRIQKPFFESKRFVERVREMAYIAKKSFIDSLIRADPEQRKEMWERFWNEKDPTPGTEKNEFLEEYYRRIDFANKNFHSPFSPGWRTDRGRVYIKLGPPDSIERHPFDIDSKAYEIWYYYTLGYRLIFVDEYNLGDYTLINPPKEDL